MPEPARFPLPPLRDLLLHDPRCEALLHSPPAPTACELLPLSVHCRDLNVDHSLKGYFLFNSVGISSATFSWCSSCTTDFVYDFSVLVNQDAVIPYEHEHPDTSPDPQVVMAILAIFLQDFRHSTRSEWLHVFRHVFLCMFNVAALVSHLD